jgi:ArsR family transcriptional regulator
MAPRASIAVSSGVFPFASARASQAQIEALAVRCAALGDPVRLRIFVAIASAGEICSCDLEAPVGKSQPTISHHTKVLVAAGLIVGEKRGRWMWWRISEGVGSSFADFVISL